MKLAFGLGARAVCVLGLLLVSAMIAQPAAAQATSRLCQDGENESPGPACLVAHRTIGKLPDAPIYWTLFTFDDVAMAERVAADASIVHAFGTTWGFVIGDQRASLEHGTRVAQIGPIPIDEVRGDYSAEFLKSTFSPGMKAPLHVHSGPEAFYAISGSTCLETPEGVQVARGAGNSLIVRRGPPMLLQAIGDETRKGFAMILHVDGEPPTTSTRQWVPRDLCPAK